MNMTPSHSKIPIESENVVSPRNTHLLIHKDWGLNKECLTFQIAKYWTIKAEAKHWAQILGVCVHNCIYTYVNYKYF